MPWSARMQIALDSARGLEYIHEHTVPVYIHRDIKPANILIDKNFRAKVVKDIRWYMSIWWRPYDFRLALKINLLFCRLLTLDLQNLQKLEVHLCKTRVSWVLSVTCLQSKINFCIPFLHSREIKKHILAKAKHIQLLSSFALCKSVRLEGLLMKSRMALHWFRYAQYGDVSPKIDVYAFGVVLYELISAKEAIIKTNEVVTESKGIVALVISHAQFLDLAVEVNSFKPLQESRFWCCHVVAYTVWGCF